jgi:hypothetical protein
MKGRLKYSTRSIALYVCVYDATFLTTTRLVFILSLFLGDQQNKIVQSNRYGERFFFLFSFCLFSFVFFALYVWMNNREDGPSKIDIFYMLVI